MGKLISSLIDPSTQVWADLFYGGGSVTLANDPFPMEICNDLFAELINYNRMVQNNPQSLIVRLKEKPYNKETFDWAQDWKFNYLDNDYVGETSAQIDYAAKFFIRNRMSRDGMLQEFTTSPRTRRGMPEMESSYLSAIDAIPELSNRISNINFTSDDALTQLYVLRYLSKACIYLDPPYLFSEASKRRTKNLYEVECDEELHEEMLKLCLDASAQIIISGYDEPLYSERLRHWNRIEKPVKINMGGGAKKGSRSEIIWSNR